MGAYVAIARTYPLTLVGTLHIATAPSHVSPGTTLRFTACHSPVIARYGVGSTVASAWVSSWAGRVWSVGSGVGWALAPRGPATRPGRAPPLCYSAACRDTVPADLASQRTPEGIRAAFMERKRKGAWRAGAWPGHD